MRFVSFSTPDGPRGGLLRDGCVFDTGRTLLSLVEAGGLDEVSAEGDGVPLAEVSLLPPIDRPGKLICIGLTYRAHAEEQGKEPPEMPTFFAKFANALAAPGAVVRLPPWSNRVDYEAGSAGRRNGCRARPSTGRRRAARRSSHGRGRSPGRDRNRAAAERWSRAT